MELACGTLFIKMTSDGSFDSFIESKMFNWTRQHISFARIGFQTNSRHTIREFQVGASQLMYISWCSTLLSTHLRGLRVTLTRVEAALARVEGCIREGLEALASMMRCLVVFVMAFIAGLHIAKSFFWVGHDNEPLATRSRWVCYSSLLNKTSHAISSILHTLLVIWELRLGCFKVLEVCGATHLSVHGSV